MVLRAKPYQMIVSLDHNDITDAGIDALIKIQIPLILYISFNHLSVKGLDSLEKAGIRYIAYGNDGDHDDVQKRLALKSVPKLDKFKLYKDYCKKNNLHCL